MLLNFDVRIELSLSSVAEIYLVLNSYILFCCADPNSDLNPYSFLEPLFLTVHVA